MLPSTTGPNPRDEKHARAPAALGGLGFRFQGGVSTIEKNPFSAGSVFRPYTEGVGHPHMRLVQLVEPQGVQWIQEQTQRQPRGTGVVSKDRF